MPSSAIWRDRGRVLVRVGMSQRPWDLGARPCDDVVKVYLDASLIDFRTPKGPEPSPEEPYMALALRASHLAPSAQAPRTSQG